MQSNEVKRFLDEWLAGDIKTGMLQTLDERRGFVNLQATVAVLAFSGMLVAVRLGNQLLLTNSRCVGYLQAAGKRRGLRILHFPRISSVHVHGSLDESSPVELAARLISAGYDSMKPDSPFCESILLESPRQAFLEWCALVCQLTGIPAFKGHREAAQWMKAALKLST